MKSYLKLTKSKRWGVCGQVTTCGRLLLSFSHAKFQTLVTGTFTHWATLSLHFSLHLCLKMSKRQGGGLCAALYIPVRDGQWGILRVSWQVWIQLGTPASMNRAENNWGRCTCTCRPIHVPTQQTCVHGENMLTGDITDCFSACLVSTGHWVPSPQY